MDGYDRLFTPMWHQLGATSETLKKKYDIMFYLDKICKILHIQHLIRKVRDIYFYIIKVNKIFHKICIYY